MARHTHKPPASPVRTGHKPLLLDWQRIVSTVAPVDAFIAALTEDTFLYESEPLRPWINARADDVELMCLQARVPAKLAAEKVELAAWLGLMLGMRSYYEGWLLDSPPWFRVEHAVRGWHDVRILVAPTVLAERTLH